MTPQELVEAALVTGTKRILVLGCFEQRVTVYSQQVRAFNLVDAILSQGLVRLNGGTVAIVGGCPELGKAGLVRAQIKHPGFPAQQSALSSPTFL